METAQWNSINKKQNGLTEEGKKRDVSMGNNKAGKKKK